MTRFDESPDPSEPPTASAGERGEITRLLELWQRGEPQALDRLVPLVYAELKRRAAGYLRGERAGHTLDPTALVHEAFLRLEGIERLDWRCREQFYAVAATTMRRLLVDHARRRAAGKRGADPGRVAMSVAEEAVEDRSGERWLDVLDVDRALGRLERVSARRARVVELRFFAGLEQTEIAGLLDISLATVEREWRAARAFLAKELADSSSGAPP